MKRVQFEHSPIPYLFIAPQIVIIVVFFLWPAAQAIYQSFLLEDAFGLSSQFVWFKNYSDTVLSNSLAAGRRLYRHILNLGDDPVAGDCPTVGGEGQ